MAAACVFKARRNLSAVGDRLRVSLQLQKLEGQEMMRALYLVEVSRSNASALPSHNATVHPSLKLIYGLSYTRSNAISSPHHASPPQSKQCVSSALTHPTGL